jgi:hypothetical protein
MVVKNGKARTTTEQWRLYDRKGSSAHEFLMEQHALATTAERSSILDLVLLIYTDRRKM